MGVHGLWQLLSSTGKPVPLESLEGKVLAVDVSVWLHQLSKGMRDSSGNPLANAHLHGLFTRICKLLYYRIKPVFVFDGGVPLLKKQTLASRRNKREDAEKTSSLMQQKILTNLIRSQALKEACGLDKLPDLPPPPKSSAKGNKDVLYQLPPIPDTSSPYLSQDSFEDKTYIQRRELQQMVEDQYEDITKIDVESEDFKALPADVQHEVMTDMRLRKKNYNLSKIVDLPDDSKDFSKYQMAKLLKHNKVNTRLEEVRKEMNTKQTRSLTKKFKGRFHDSDDIYSQRVVSEDSAHYILAKRNFSQKREEESKNLIKVEEEMVTDKLEGIEEVDEFLIDSDADSCSEVDIMEESRLIFEELSGKPDEIQDDVENKREKTTRKEVIKQQEDVGKSEEDKPRFRAVIEVESDSGSDTSDDSVKGVGEETIVLDDTNVDPELQFAIELSLQEQRKSGESNSQDVSVQGSESLEDTKDVDAQTAVMKNSNSSRTPLVTAGRQTCQMSTEERQQDVVEASRKQQNKQRKVGTLIGSSSINSDNIKGKCKVHSNESTGRNNHDYKQVKKVERNKDKCVNEPNNKDTYTTRRLDSGEMKSRIFKRNISCLSNDSTGSCEEPVKVRKIDLSDVDTDIDADISESSDSEGDFIEVKVDLTKFREDDLFPASMFEAKEMTETKPALHDKHLADVDDTVVAIGDDDVAVVEKEEVSSESEAKIHDKVTVVDSDTNKMVDYDTDRMEKDSTNDNSKNRNEVIVDEQLEVRSTGSDVIEAEDDVAMVSEVDDVSLESTEVPLNVADNKKRSSSPNVPSLVKQFESLNEQDVRGLRMNLASENRQLRLEQGRQERLAVSITDQMHTEAQELLQLFGIPYIVSPTEAEAQCAQLELVKLTSGTITDDSDIWLFGGKCVFKNFFNQQKHVECFKDVNISSQLGLTRESLINLALLCGSDYTEGIRGVGPVTAMEILAKFQGNGLEGLRKLKSWWEDAQKEIRISMTTSKLLTKLRDLDISEGFPNSQVVEAYLSPVVDDSTEKFTWSLPNLEELRQFAGSKLKWNREKTDEVLLPVMKRLSERQTQRSISAFFQPEVYMNPAPVKSKRLQKVVKKFINPSEEQEDSDNEQEKKKTKSKGQGNNKKSRAKGQPESEQVEKEAGKNGGKAANKKRKEAKSEEHDKDKPKSDLVSKDELVSLDIDVGAAGPGCKTKISGTSSQGRGKSRGRGRGQKSSVRSGDGKIEKVKIILSDSDSSVDTDSDSSDSSMSSSDDNDDYDDGKTNEINVVQTGLNIDEILNLKMGCTFNEIKSVKKSKQEGKVVENIMNVNEILHLESGDNDGYIINGNVKKKKIDKDSDSVKDNEETGDEKFANAGGFIREEEDIEMEDCPELESEDFMSQLQALEEKCATDTVYTKGLAKGNTTQNIVPAEKKTKAKISESVTDIAEDSCKIETKRTRSSRTNSMRDGSKVLLTKIKHDPKGGIQSEDNISSQTETEVLIKTEETNTDSGVDNFDVNTRVLKTEKSEIEEADKTKESSKSEKIKEKPAKSLKTETKLKKAKADSIYKSDPIKPLVSGLPWAEKRKGQRRGQGAKGKGKMKVNIITPVETIKKKVKSAEKKTFDCVNLSESDSDN